MHPSLQIALVFVPACALCVYLFRVGRRLDGSAKEVEKTEATMLPGYHRDQVSTEISRLRLLSGICNYGAFLAVAGAAVWALVVLLRE